MRSSFEFLSICLKFFTFSIFVKTWTRLARLCEVAIYSFQLEFFLQLFIVFLAALKGKRLFADHCGTMASAHPGPPQSCSRPTEGTACGRGRLLGLIVIRMLILQHRIANQQQLMSSRNDRTSLSPALSYPIVHTGYRSVILVNVRLSRFHHHPTEPTATLLGDAAMPDRSARSVRGRNKPSVTAKSITERKPADIAYLALHKQSRIIPYPEQSSKA